MHPDLSAVRVQNTIQKFQCCAFSAAIMTYESQSFTVMDMKTDMVKNMIQCVAISLMG